jgi:hypothetical protein
MTIAKTAYDTTACVGYNLSKTVSAIEAAYSEGSVQIVPLTNIKQVVGGTALSNNIPAFSHPLITIVHNREIGDMFIDVRSFGVFDNVNQVFKVRNDIDYKLMVARAKLNYLWVEENQVQLRDVSNAPMAIFASWISEAIGRRFALDPREQFNLGILAAIFYNSQFTNETEFNERDKLRSINAITRALRASAQDVIDILDKVSLVKSVTEFCALSEEVTGSIRLKELNVGILFSIMGGTWFGTNAKEMVAVAIEHPPTWLAILLASFTERTFRNSQIAKLTERNSFRQSGEDFVRATLNLIKTIEIERDSGSNPVAG